MNWILRIAWYFAGQYIQGQLFLRAKRQGIVAYIHTLQTTRQVLMLVVLALFVLQIVMLAGVGALVAGLMLLDMELKKTLLILFTVFSALFFIPVLALIILFNERIWYRVSGAEKLVEDLRAPSDSKAA